MAYSVDAAVGTVYLYDNEKPEVTLSAPVPVVAEQATTNAAVVRINCNPAPLSDLTVTYTVAGTATAGVDYVALSGSAVIPAGSSYVDILIKPIDDTIAEMNETVVVTLSANSAITLGSAKVATVTILDNDL